MAWAEKYANFDLGTGANDGSSEANAWQTPAAMQAAIAPGDHCYIKRQSSAYNLTTTLTASVSGTATAPIWYECYATTPGDKGMWLVNYNTGGIATLSFTGAYCYVEGIDFQPGATTNQHAFNVTGANSLAIRCRGIMTVDSNFANMRHCDFVLAAAGGGDYSLKIAGTNVQSVGWYFNRLRRSGSTSSTNLIKCDVYGQGINLWGNLIIGAGNSGENGCFVDRANNCRVGYVGRNVFYNFNHAILFDEEPDSPFKLWTIIENIFDTMAGKGVKRTNTEQGYVRALRNWYYAMASGFTDYSTEAEVDGNVALTGSPFADPGSNDFTLNNTSGAGAILRAVGWPINERYDWANMTNKATYEGAGGGGVVISGGMRGGFCNG